MSETRAGFVDDVVAILNASFNENPYRMEYVASIATRGDRYVWDGDRFIRCFQRIKVQNPLDGNRPDFRAAVLAWLNEQGGE